MRARYRCLCSYLLSTSVAAAPCTVIEFTELNVMSKQELTEHACKLQKLVTANGRETDAVRTKIDEWNEIYTKHGFVPRENSSLDRQMQSIMKDQLACLDQNEKAKRILVRKFKSDIDRNKCSAE